MIDLVRRSALASNAMQFAARGALLVPPQEMIEILVHLAVHNKVFSDQARMTLAGWDDSSARAAAADQATPQEVLDYFIDPHNLKPTLLPLLLENPSVSEVSLVTLAGCATREQVEVLLNSARVSHSPAILKVLASNPHLREHEIEKMKEAAPPVVPEAKPQETASDPPEETKAAPADHTADHTSDQTAASTGDSEAVSEETLKAYLSEHAAEIVAEAGKAFQPIGGVYDEIAPEPQPAPAGTPAVSASGGAQGEVTAAKRAPAKKWILSAEEQRGSALQKISKLDIKGRIQLAMKGNKEERSLLIRDGTKIVALAVLESPKVTDGEVERFAGQKNVLEAVLRAIPMKRRFVKQYAVVRNLTSNPRTPIDVSLGLIKHLLMQDLRHLAGNKEVSDTVRKLATKMFRQKLDVTKKGE